MGVCPHHEMIANGCSMSSVSSCGEEEVVKEVVEEEEQDRRTLHGVHV